MTQPNQQPGGSQPPFEDAETTHLAQRGPENSGGAHPYGQAPSEQPAPGYQSGGYQGFTHQGYSEYPQSQPSAGYPQSQPSAGYPQSQPSANYQYGAPQNYPQPGYGQPQPSGDYGYGGQGYGQSTPSTPREPHPLKTMFNPSFSTMVTPKLARFVWIVSLVTAAVVYVAGVIVSFRVGVTFAAMELLFRGGYESDAKVGVGAYLPGVATLLLGWIPVLLGLMLIRVLLEWAISAVRTAEDVAVLRENASATSDDDGERTGIRADGETTGIRDDGDTTAIRRP